MYVNLGGLHLHGCSAGIHAQVIQTLIHNFRLPITLKQNPHQIIERACIKTHKGEPHIYTQAHIYINMFYVLHTMCVCIFHSWMHIKRKRRCTRVTIAIRIFYQSRSYIHVYIFIWTCICIYIYIYIWIYTRICEHSTKNNSIYTCYMCVCF